MQCVSPLSVERVSSRLEKAVGLTYKSGSRHIVRCGKCALCKKMEAIQWTLRLSEHIQDSYTARFVTVTYDERNLPLVGPLPTLCPKDLTDFHKRIRNQFKADGHSEKLEYFTIGEYGDRFHRPHYHGIYYNLPLDILPDYTTAIPSGGIRSPYLESIWKKGNVHVGHATKQSIGYATGYMFKLSDIKDLSDPRRPEFRRMSKNLGAGYVARHRRWHRDNNTPHALYEGQQIPLPQKWLRQMFSKQELAEFSEKYQEDTAINYYQDYQRLKALGVKDPAMVIENV